MVYKTFSCKIAFAVKILKFIKYLWNDINLGLQYATKYISSPLSDKKW